MYLDVELKSAAIEESNKTGTSLDGSDIINLYLLADQCFWLWIYELALSWIHRGSGSSSWLFSLV